MDFEAVAVTVKELVNYALTINPNNHFWLIIQADIYFGKWNQHLFFGMSIGALFLLKFAYLHNLRCISLYEKKLKWYDFKIFGGGCVGEFTEAVSKLLDWAFSGDLILG